MTEWHTIMIMQFGYNDLSEWLGLGIRKIILLSCATNPKHLSPEEIAEDRQGDWLTQVHADIDTE